MVVKFACFKVIGGLLRIKLGEIAIFSFVDDDDDEEGGGGVFEDESGRGVSGCEIDINLGVSD